MRSYESYTGRKKMLILFLLVLNIATAILAIQAGSTNLTPYQVLQALLGQGAGISDVVIWNIRLPRVLAGVIAGAGLAVAGCVMQNNLRNPLASPSTLGISNAAVFGANIGIIALGAGSMLKSSTPGVFINNPYLVTVAAFMGAMLATMVIMLLARFRGFSPEAMVLAGVALSSLFSAGTILIQYFAEDVQVAAVVFWTFGDLGRAAWNEITLMAVIVGLAGIYFMARRWDYNALDSGEDSAKSLGVNVERVRMEGMLLSSLITAVVTAFLGIIGFVGLVAPQIMRRILGGDHRFLIPASALTGSLLLLISDTFARTIISPLILPVGAITSFLGAPLFLYFLARGYQKR